MLSQDSKGHYYQILSEVFDHSSGGTDIKRKYEFIQYNNVNMHFKQTTCGWKILVERKDGSTS